VPESIPIIVELLVGAGAATSIGTSIYSATNQPGAPKPVTPTPAQATADATKTRTTQEAALSQQAPGIQAATGGSLSPEAKIQMEELLAGLAGAPGIGGSIQDLLTKLKGGGGTVTAGNATSSSGPGLTL
jgi:hypothetical protein